MQLVVLDKMDYCASLHNIAAVLQPPNVKVCRTSSRCQLSAGGQLDVCFGFMGPGLEG
jgi:hypothetical protein